MHPDHPSKSGSRTGGRNARLSAMAFPRDKMSDRSWFCASQGQQYGPYLEVQLREFIARGAVTADTLVWTEGMADWQRAGEIPGLMAGAANPPSLSQAGRSPVVVGRDVSGVTLSADLPLWG